MTIRSIRLVAGWLVLALAVTGCPRAQRRGAPEPVPAKRGGTLEVRFVEDVDSLDPHRAARPSSWFFARALHRGLYAFPTAGGTDPVADLAAGMPSVSRDRLRVTVRLRAGARFGGDDERAVAAGDVRASLLRLIRADRGIAPFLAVVRRIDAPDERTVRIRLRRPVNDLLWLLAHPQAAVVPRGTPERAHPLSIAGAGPYRLRAYEPERRIELARNRSWSADSDPVRRAHVDRIVATSARTAAAAVSEVASGDADLLVEPGPPDARSPKIPEGTETEISGGVCVRYLFLNVRVSPFDERVVRQAVSRAVDRDLLVRAPDELAVRILPPAVEGNRKAAVLREDIARARALLRSAGRREGFTTTLVVANSPRDRDEASGVRRALARAGIRVRIRRVSPATLYPEHYEVPSRRVPMGIATWCADWPGRAGRGVLGVIADPRARRSGRGNPVYAGLSSRGIARAVAGASTAVRPAGAWAEADRLVVASGAIVPLAWMNERVALSDRLRGWSRTPMWPRGDPTALWLS